MNRFIIVLVMWMLTSCATTTPNISALLMVVDMPPIGQVSTIEVGSSLVQKAKVYEYEAYELLDTYVHKGSGYHMGVKYTFDPGFYALTKEDKNWRYFIAVGDLVESCAIRICSRPSGGFMKSKQDERLKVFEHLQKPAKIIEMPNWKPTTYAAIDEPNFRRELVYNGRAGSAIRLLYREFSKDMIRPAFSQELTYDLSEGKIVGFQGVRIEVLETNNIGITYRVLSSFPDRDAVN